MTTKPQTSLQGLHEAVDNACATIDRLRAENTRMREALEEISDECFSGSAHDVARAALMATV